MTTLSSLVSRAGNFSAFTTANKICFFAWHLHSHRGLERFAPGDIVACFDEVHVHRPSNPSASLKQLLDKNVLIKDKNGYRLAKSQRDSLGERYGSRRETVIVDQLLSDLLGMVSDVAQQDYLSEAIVCFRHQAFRAAVVMAWNAVYDHLVTVITNKHAVAFNAQMSTMFGGKKKPVATKDDFQRLKESEVVEVCNAGALISKEVAKVLNDKLDKRNSAAHPSGSTIDKLQAEAYISDLIKNAMIKIQ